MSFLADPISGLLPPVFVQNITPWVNSVRFYPLYGPCRQETQLADMASTRALALCLFEGIGVYDMRWSVALSAMDANDPSDELAVRVVEHSEVLHARASTSHAHTGASPSPRTFSMRTFGVNEAVSISYSSSLNRLKNAHASQAHVLISGIISAVSWVRSPRYKKLCCLFTPLVCCFDDERRGKGCLVRHPQQHRCRLLL